ALGFPLASTLSGNALPVEPIRDLTIVVANLNYCCLDERSVGVSVVVGELDQSADASAGESTRPLRTHVVKACFRLRVEHDDDEPWKMHRLLWSRLVSQPSETRWR